MTDREWHRLVAQSVRAARRTYRRADTAGEVLERWLDRQVARKTRLRPDQALKVEPLWIAYRDNVKALERALADMLQATSLL